MIFSRFRSLFLVCVGTATSALVATATEFSKKFDFGTDRPASGYVGVSAQSAFTADRGYGFEGDAVLTAIARSGEPVERDYLSSAKPFFFSVSVPEGNYRVTVLLGDTNGSSSTTVKAENRRLMLENVSTAAGQHVRRSFIVNVRNRTLPAPPLNAPGGSEVRLNDRELGMRNWDDKLTLEFNGSEPKVCGVEIEFVDLPTIFLAGDSTVTDQPAEPGASWGQMLPRFFRPDVAVANHAESGETLKSFLAELRLDKIFSQAKPGDYLFLQFGHNDSKMQWPQTYVEAGTTYKAYLAVYIAEARRRGMTPVLITSVQRRTFDERGKIKNSHGDYPDAVRQLAKDLNVALIDLHAMSTQLYEALGPDGAPQAFSAGGRDATHHNNYGAYELARCIVEGIRAAKLPLAEHIADDAGHFDPARPDLPATFSLPPSPGHDNTTPRGS